MSAAGKVAQRRLREAKKAVERAEQARREAFRKALVTLFNEYRLYLVADGDMSAHLRIEEMREGARAYPIEELPK